MESERPKNGKRLLRFQKGIRGLWSLKGEREHTLSGFARKGKACRTNKQPK
jgi:hypothetical protein